MATKAIVIIPDIGFWRQGIECPNCKVNIDIDAYAEYFDCILNGYTERYYRRGSILVPVSQTGLALLPYQTLERASRRDYAKSHGIDETE